MNRRVWKNKLALGFDSLPLQKASTRLLMPCAKPRYNRECMNAYEAYWLEMWIGMHLASIKHIFAYMCPLRVDAQLRLKNAWIENWGCCNSQQSPKIFSLDCRYHHLFFVPLKRPKLNN